jgi:hypothetical protein
MIKFGNIILNNYVNTCALPTNILLLANIRSEKSISLLNTVLPNIFSSPISVNKLDANIFKKVICSKKIQIIKLPFGKDYNCRIKLLEDINKPKIFHANQSIIQKIYQYKTISSIDLIIIKPTTADELFIFFKFLKSYFHFFDHKVRYSYVINLFNYLEGENVVLVCDMANKKLCWYGCAEMRSDELSSNSEDKKQEMDMQVKNDQYNGSYQFMCNIL